MASKTFPKQDLLDLLDKEDFDGYKWISNDITGNSRWSIFHEMIFEHEGKFYRANYSVGATEAQDEYPFEHDNDEVPCTLIIPVEKIITVYEDAP